MAKRRMTPDCLGFPAMVVLGAVTVLGRIRLETGLRTRRSRLLRSVVHRPTRAEIRKELDLSHPLGIPTESFGRTTSLPQLSLKNFHVVTDQKSFRQMQISCRKKFYSKHKNLRLFSIKQKKKILGVFLVAKQRDYHSASWPKRFEQ